MKPPTVILKLEPGQEVDMVSASVAHHHATGHDGSGGGLDYSCNGCDFEIEDNRVIHGGAVEVLADAGDGDEWTEP